jgi:hypothetical protein
VRITLRCQAPAEALPGLAVQAGQGALVCCSADPAAVATAQRVFPDRRIEVKSLYREPGLNAGRSLLGWMLHARPGEESHEEVRRRVIDSSIRLIAVAKEQDESSLVAGPRLLRLLALKLNSIGYRGPLLAAWKPGDERHFSYVI